MPVLPLVASISVSPGLICPRSSARRIIDSAGLSFTDPAGSLPSSFASMTLLVWPGMRFRRTNGVLPTKSSRVLRALTGLRSMWMDDTRAYGGGKEGALTVCQQPADIAPDADLYVGKRHGILRGAQVIEVRLGK